MRTTDIAIVGGGLAGSTAAAMLGRAGIDAILVDPHPAYPKDFRCEKLDASQIALLRKTGLADAVLAAATPDREVSIIRFGHMVELRPIEQADLLYDDMVNAMRRQIPASVETLHGKATAIVTGADRQHLTLSTKHEISARLVVLANGLNISLRDSLGIGREIRSANHSISIGFDVIPLGRSAFDFVALNHYPDRASNRMAYLTLFPIGTAMRANLFVYRELDDPWLRQMRHDGAAALFELLPGLRRFTGDIEVRDVKIRPVDLYVSTGYCQAGVALVGDAFGTSCPAAGTGCNKVFTDVERLCNVHIPRWLASPGMGVEKIESFYQDPVKMACDAASEDKAYYLRSLSTEIGFSWQARRWSRFIGQIGVGALRQARGLIAARDRGQGEVGAGRVQRAN